MRFAILATAALLPVLAASPARAEVPNSVAALLGPSVGYLLAQSDLCQWGLTGKIEQIYRVDFTTIGMTAAQQASTWSQAAARRKALNVLPAAAKAHMKADTCTAASRAGVEHDLSD